MDSITQWNFIKIRGDDIYDCVNFICCLFRVTVAHKMEYAFASVGPQSPVLRTMGIEDLWEHREWVALVPLLPGHQLLVSRRHRNCWWIYGHAGKGYFFLGINSLLLLFLSLSSWTNFLVLTAPDPLRGWSEVGPWDVHGPSAVCWQGIPESSQSRSSSCWPTALHVGSEPLHSWLPTQRCELGWISLRSCYKLCMH